MVVSNKTQITVEKGTLNLISIAGVSAGFLLLQTGQTWFEIARGGFCLLAGVAVHFYYQKLKVNSRWKVK